MSDFVIAALIGATASVIGSVLTYLVGIRSIRRSVSASNGAPLGPLLESRLERLERRLDAMERSIGDVRARIPRGKGAPAALDAPQPVVTGRVPISRSNASRLSAQPAARVPASDLAHEDVHLVHRASPTDNPVFLSIAQVAARLGISRAHCYRLAGKGLLPVLQLGRRKVVPAHWLQRWLDDRYKDLAESETASAE